MLFLIFGDYLFLVFVMSVPSSSEKSPVSPVLNEASGSESSSSLGSRVESAALPVISEAPQKTWRPTLSVSVIQEETGKSNALEFEDSVGQIIGDGSVVNYYTPDSSSSDWLRDVCSFFRELESGGSLVAVGSSDVDKNLRRGVTHTFVARNSARENLAIVKPALGCFSSSLYKNWQKMHRQRYAIDFVDMIPRERLAFVVSEYLFSDWKEGCVKVPETHLFKLPARFFVGGPIDDLNGSDTVFCSVQQFVPLSKSLTQVPRKSFDEISPEQFRAFAVLDILLYSTDRGRQNALVSNGSSLVPIDHGLILSKGFIDSVVFFWIGCPACNTPFSVEEKEAILKLDWMTLREVVLQTVPGIDSDSLYSLNATLDFLQTGVRLGLNAYQIGSLLCRGSELEIDFLRQAYLDALDLKGPSSSFSGNVKQAIEKYLIPCAGFILDPKNQELLTRRYTGYYGCEVSAIAMIVRELQVLRLHLTEALRDEGRDGSIVIFQEVFKNHLEVASLTWKSQSEKL